MEHNKAANQCELTAGGLDEQSLWFCVQTHPKHEHIAAAALAKVGGFEVFNPQMRIRRATKRGPVWFTESAFAGYIFARFDLQTHLYEVRHSASVSKVVHFSSGYPSIPDLQMKELKSIFGADGIVILTPEFAAGDTVTVPGARWQTAAWFVANADRLGIESVAYDGQTWTELGSDSITMPAEIFLG